MTSDTRPHGPAKDLSDAGFHRVIALAIVTARGGIPPCAHRGGQPVHQDFSSVDNVELSSDSSPSVTPLVDHCGQSANN